MAATCRRSCLLKTFELPLREVISSHAGNEYQHGCKATDGSGEAFWSDDEPQAHCPTSLAEHISCKQVPPKQIFYGQANCMPGAFG